MIDITRKNGRKSIAKNQKLQYIQEFYVQKLPMTSLKSWWLDAEVLRIEVSCYTRVQGQIFSPNEIYVFSYGELKLLESSEM